MGVVPSFFNINEPILFGAPIIMNPMLFIPFVCVPLVNACGVRGNQTGLAGTGGIVNAVDHARTNWCLMGRQLGAEPGGDVSHLYGDVSADVPAVPACLRAYVDENEEQKAQATVGTAETASN